ncbi:integrase core domain-containing protein, partial [Nocardioides caldifontis]|uniref:integrase core domain-containing protein n=1 Tax=Nocardioides caldifontis TaxID=2588938 RepID=UPI00193A2354
CAAPPASTGPPRSTSSNCTSRGDCPREPETPSGRLHSEVDTLEALNSLFKAECIRNPAMRPKGGWKNVSDVEIAVAEYVDWYNHRRLHGEIGLVPPAEFETNHWASQPTERYRENPVLTEVGSN